MALALLGALALLIAYGVLVEPRLWLDQERHRIAVPGLPADAPPVTVAAFSDLQVGMWLSNEDMIDDIVERVVEERPTAALIGGDYVIGTDPPPAEQIDRVVELLAPLTAAGIPTYAVLGNHDYEVDAADEVAEALEEIGIRVLRFMDRRTAASWAAPAAGTQMSPTTHGAAIPEVPMATIQVTGKPARTTPGPHRARRPTPG